MNPYPPQYIADCIDEDGGPCEGDVQSWGPG